METSLSLSVLKDVDSNTVASMKRSADEMDSDCGDSSLELTSNKRFHRECGSDEVPSSNLSNLPASHVESEQSELIIAISNVNIAHIKNKITSTEQVDFDKNISDEATLLSTTDDDNKIFIEAAADDLQTIERNQDLMEISLERKDVLTDKLIVCSLTSLERVKDIVNCSPFSNVDSSSQINEDMPIAKSSIRQVPIEACEREFDREKTIGVGNTLAGANVDSEVLNLSTKSLDASVCLETIQSPGIVGAFDVGTEIIGESLDLPIDLSVGHKALPSPLSQKSHNNAPYQACIKTESIVDPVDFFIKSNGRTSDNSVGKQNEERGVSTIKRLEDELRNEESKLVLLRKLRQNQVFYQYVIDSAHSRGLSERHTSQQHPPRLLNNGPPPQLVRGTPQSLTGNHRLSSSPHRVISSGVSISDPSSRLLPVKSSQHGQPPLLVVATQPSPTVSQMSLLGSLQNLRTLSSSITMQSSSRGSPIPLLNVRMQQPSPQQPMQPPTTIVTVQQTSNEQSPAQRQAAAKLALRKQLEKTLLQIPPPKPPPPEMNFVPNSLNGEFVILLGLEEAVKCIVDNDARAKGHPISEVKYVFNPFQCVQCNTDFTPVWKRDRPGSRSVICERCVTTNQKRALKQEHTNRLKSAFVKALQQEQEIEQSIHGNNGNGSFGTLSLSNSSQFIPPISSMMTSTQSASLLSSVSSSKNSLSTGYLHRPGIDLVHSQPNALQHLLPAVPPHALIRSSVTPTSAGSSLTFNPNLFFPYPPKSVASNSTAEMQRQYLLDMIPRRSQLDLPILWRT